MKTTVCAIQHQSNKEGDSDVLGKVYPIAGELIEQGGANLDAKWELLKNSKSNDDSTKEGLRLEINGGFKKTESGTKRPQKAIVEFLCDKSRTGLEHLPTPRDPYEESKDKRADKDDGDKDEGGDKDKDKGGDKDEGLGDDGEPSLQFVRYDTDGKDADVLRLLWKTKYACDDANPLPEHWGVFTWFLIMYASYPFLLSGRRTLC